MSRAVTHNFQATLDNEITCDARQTIPKWQKQTENVILRQPAL